MDWSWPLQEWDGPLFGKFLAGRRSCRAWGHPSHCSKGLKFLNRTSLTLQVDFFQRDHWRSRCFDVLTLFYKVGSVASRYKHLERAQWRWVPKIGRKRLSTSTLGCRQRYYMTSTRLQKQEWSLSGQVTENFTLRCTCRRDGAAFPPNGDVVATAQCEKCRFVLSWRSCPLKSKQWDSVVQTCTDQHIESAFKNMVCSS